MTADALTNGLIVLGMIAAVVLASALVAIRKRGRK